MAVSPKLLAAAPVTTDKTSMVRKFLTLAEVAGEIGCSRRFLEKRIEDGELKAFKPSTRLVRIRRSELERWIEQHSVGGKPKS
jgi:excisionase family DNA binding protein